MASVKSVTKVLGQDELGFVQSASNAVGNESGSTSDLKLEFDDWKSKVKLSEITEQLRTAVRRGDLEKTKEILLSPNVPRLGRQLLLEQKDDDDNNDLLNTAAVYGHLLIVEWLVESMGANIESCGLYNRTPLLQACSNGSHVDVVKYLVRKGADKNVVEESIGGQAIHLAARFSDVETVKFLLELQPEFIEARSTLTSRTPLLHAAGWKKQNKEKVQQETGCNLAVLQFLLENGANIDAVDGDGGSRAIHLAAHWGSTETVELLLKLRPHWLELKNKWGRTAFLNAAVGGNLAVTNLLIEKGANIDVVDSLGGATAIHLAAYFGNRDIVEHLLKLRPQWLDVKDSKRGRTPFIDAASAGRLAVVKLLVDKGANTDVVDSIGGAGAINHAAKFGSTETVEYLLTLKPQWLEARDTQFGRTPFLHAAARGNLAVVKLLVEKGADIDAVDSKGGLAAIHLAAQFGNPETVEYLLELRPQWLEAEDSKCGRTPFLRAAEGGNLAVVKWLAEKGADTYTVDSFATNTALHLAAYFGHKEVCSFLNSKMPSLLSTQNKQGNTPLARARQNNQEAVVALLTSLGTPH